MRHVQILECRILAPQQAALGNVRLLEFDALVERGDDRVDMLLRRSRNQGGQHLGIVAVFFQIALP